MRPAFTFSALERADKCPASTVLPQTRNDGDAFAGRGHAVHGYLQDVPHLGPIDALARVPEEHRDACEAINLDGLPVEPGMYAAEVAYAYDVDTEETRELGRGINRNYGTLLRREIAGTVDVVGLTADAVVVIDYKSGFAPLPPARDVWQLRMGALAAARRYQRERALVAIIRIKENGESYWDRGELSMVDLDITADAVRNVFGRCEDAGAKLAGMQGVDTREGAHCRYCPAFAFCPSKMALLREVTGTKGDGAILPPVLTAENAPLVYERLEMVRQVVKRVETVLEDWARVTSIPLPNGYVYGVTQTARESIDAGKAIDVLKGVFGDEAGKVLDKALETELTMTKKGLSAGIRAYLQGKPQPRGILGRTEKQALEALRSAGAVTVSTTASVKEHKPKPAALLAATEESADHAAA